MKKIFVAECFDGRAIGHCFTFVADDDRDGGYRGEIGYNRKERIKNLQQAFKDEYGFDIREADIGDIWILDFSRDYRDEKEYKIKLE